MGMRKYQRQIAKARLKAMGVGNVNKKMNGKVRLSHGQVRKMYRTKLGRKRMKLLAHAGISNWRRVLWGDLATEAFMAQCHPEELKRKRKKGRIIRHIEKPDLNTDIKGTIRVVSQE